jgi:hypothetical protein
MGGLSPVILSLSKDQFRSGGPGFDRRVCINRTREPRRKRGFTENRSFSRNALEERAPARLPGPYFTPSENILSPVVYPVYARLTPFPKVCEHACHEND